MTALAATLVLGQLLGNSPGGVTSNLSVSDRSEVRSRSVPATDRRATDVDTTPAATITVNTRRSAYGLGYGARFAYLDVTRAATFAAMHSARISGAFWGRRLRLLIAGDGSIGRQSWVGLAPAIRLSTPEDAPPTPPPANGGTTTPTPTPAPTPLPTAQPVYLISPKVVDSASLRGTLSLTYNLDRRWSGAANAYAAMAGGFDYFDQRAFPPSRALGGDVSAGYAVTRRDQMSTRLRSTYQYVLTTGGNFLTLDATESWRHNWSARTSGSFGAGLLYLSSRSKRAEDPKGSVSLAGDASLLHARPLRDGRSVAFRGAASTGAYYNPVVGAVQSALTAMASSTYTHRSFTVTASADATTTLSGTSRARTYSTALVGAYAPGDVVALQLGLRAYGQLMPSGTQANYPFQWVAFAAVGITLPTVQLL